jgi:uncharacterized protein (UPF0248 family)
MKRKLIITDYTKDWGYGRYCLEYDDGITYEAETRIYTDDIETIKETVLKILEGWNA